jgi:hypothetical protein
MTRRRKPPSVFARETADTSDEYAEHRIKNCDDAEHLNAIIEVEVERDDPRRDRIGWANERLQEVRS